jgi:hypothetical protein
MIDKSLKGNSLNQFMTNTNRLLIIIIFALSPGYGKVCHAQQTHHVVVSINQGSACQIVGIAEESLLKYQLFPNPVKDELTILSSENDVSVSMLDLFGRIVASETTLVENKLKIDVQGFAKGVYYIHLKSKRKTEYMKIIIHE